jgi:small subunit ribosomal protein S15
LPKKKQGRSHQNRPVSKRPPSWCKYTADEVEALIIRLAKDGHPPSKIGSILRDQHGIPLTKPITGKPITTILREAGLAPSIPENLETLMRKAARLHSHLEKNMQDFSNKRALNIIEARIYKLVRYYKQEGVLPPDWKYQPQKVALI